MITHKVTFQESTERLDILLTRVLKLQLDIVINRSSIVKYLDKYISVNGKHVKKSYRVEENDEILIDEEKIVNEIKRRDSDEIVSQIGNLDIIDETSEYIIINKPCGLVVHPGSEIHQDTLANYIKGYLEAKGEYDDNIQRAGIVHRLDKGVSGLIIIAKTRTFQEYIKKEIEEHRIRKIYHAILNEKHDRGNTNLSVIEILKQYDTDEAIYDNWDRVEGYIRRSPYNRKKMVFSTEEGGKEAVSYIYYIKTNEVLVNIVTGRMHQIRATLKFLGYTIEGDDLYTRKDGRNSNSISLKAVQLRFKNIDETIKTYSIL